MTVHHPHRPHRLRSALWACVLIVSLLAGSLPVAGAPSPSELQADPEPLAPRADAPYQIYLPVVLKLGVASPGDGLLVSWDQEISGAGRTVLLRWRVPSAVPDVALLATTKTIAFTVQRRVAGTATWQTIGTAAFAPNATAMATLLGPTLTEQLRTDLAGFEDPLTAFEDPLTAQELFDLLRTNPSVALIVAQRYYQAALATGMGFLDPSAPPNTTLEYRVIPEGGTRTFEPATIPPTGNAVPVPTALREVWIGPTTGNLGQPGSTRPQDAAERYSWLTTQHYQQWDGTVYLTWDMPLQGVVNKGTLEEGRDAMNLAGYRVYRAPHRTTQWVSLNPRKDRCSSGPYCEMMVGASPFPEDGVIPAHHFQDKLHESTTAPADPYGIWDYKVCAVSLLGREVGCSNVLTVDVRELTPPRHVDEISAFVPENQSQISISWTYSDTHELNPPLTFYVTRSPELTLAPEQWTPIATTQVPGTGPLNLAIVDTPPLDRLFWYRIQVRDNAGNWSSTGVPVSAARYTRTGPPFAAISYDQNCALNAMPLTLTGLDPAIQVVNVYRSFDPGGPFTLFERFIVQGGSVTIDDTFQPPDATFAYYRFQALDGHGNTSVERPYCAQLGDGPLVHPGPPAIDTDLINDPEIGTTLLVTPTGPTGGPNIVIDIARPGPTGLVTTTEEIKQPFESSDFNPGATVGITAAYAPADTITNSVTLWLRDVNNFLDTDRHLTDLGEMSTVQWMTDTTTGAHYVHLDIAPVDEPSPPVAIFRRADRAAWMQIDGVRSIQPMIYDDRSDLDPRHSYEYAVVLLSPDSYEMLGAYRPITLPALHATNAPPMRLSDRIEHPPALPTLCATTMSREPLGGIILLENEWQITNLSYWVATDRTCPPDMPTGGEDPNDMHLWGDGLISNGTVTRMVEFLDIAVIEGAGGMVHDRGPIVVEMGVATGGVKGLKRYVGRLEFTPTSARAEVTFTLPPAVTVESTTYERTHEIFAVVPNVTKNLIGDPVSLDKLPITVVDESLPWRLATSTATLNHEQLSLGAGTQTSSRLTYTPVTGWPDSNLAYLRAAYSSTSARVSVDGLQGVFGTTQRIDYRTSFPADLRINATGGAELVIIDSAIDRGTLRGATAELNYDTAGTTIDYVTADAYCDGEPDNHFHLCKGRIGSFVPAPHRVPLTLGDNLIPIGENGQILSEVGLSSEIRWPSFSFWPVTATLYIAPAAFSGTPTTWAPLPAEVAWQRIDNPDESIEATYDPGINFQVVGAPVDYLFYDPATFDPSNYALYLRRGGVSGHLIMEDTTPRTNAYGYSENVQRIELLFIDNAIVPPLLDFITDLTLPYPSQITFPLEVTGCDDRNRPLLGVFRDGFTDARHRYWGFTEAPKSWVWGHTTSTEYTAEIVIAQPRIFTLQNSTAVVDGLVPRNGGPGAASVELTFTTEWFPDGDYGALRLLAPKDVPYRTGSFRFNLSAVKLSRYYSEPLNPDSLPSTLGIDLTHTMDTLPKELLTAAGALTGASLKACATSSSNFGDNCGFIVLDGDVEVDYFGRVKSSGLTTQAADFSIPALDAVYGQYAVAVNTILDVTKFVGMLSGYVPWIWPQINGLLDVNLPVKFLGNTQGGVIVGLYRNAPIAADNEFLTADAAGIIQIAWGGNTFQDQVGVFLGYSASQAAFRALAMNRPADTGGPLPYTAWDDVKDDIAAWAPKFGYPTNLSGVPDDSPVDLAQRVWPTWGTKDWALVHSVIEPVLKELDGDDAYGVTGVEPGTKLQSTALVLNTTSLSAVFRPQGAGIEITEFSGGGQGQFDIWAYQAWEVWDVDLIDVDVYLRVDWAGFRITRDGEIRLDASAHFNLIYDWGVDGTLAAIAVPAGDEWRFEGALDVAPIGLAGVSALELDGVFGSGPYEKPGGGYEQLFYYGGNVVGYFLESRVGGGFLYGVIPQESAILREGGVGEILDTLGDKPTYQGIYVYVFGEFPVADESCLLRAVVGGELRFWYFGSVWGGGISGYAHATVACLISARGQVDLGYARLDHGGQQWSRTCNNPGGTCDAFGGAFWIAVGVGWCEPSTWRSWRSRWWGDSWCYTFGAYVDLTYLSPGGIDYDWDLDFE